jgi:hypothetical protein
VTIEGNEIKRPGKKRVKELQAALLEIKDGLSKKIIRIPSGS